MAPSSSISTKGSLTLIACLAANRVIGRDGQIPWHLKADLRRFKELTLGHPIVMGRRTFASIGRALPGRRNLVVTSHPLEAEGVETVRSLQEAVDLCAGAELFVIGGERLYSEALANAQRLYLTRLERNFEGDTYFPDFAALPFVLQDSERHYDDALNLYYSFETWVLT